MAVQESRILTKFQVNPTAKVSVRDELRYYNPLTEKTHKFEPRQKQ